VASDKLPYKYTPFKAIFYLLLGLKIALIRASRWLKTRRWPLWDHQKMVVEFVVILRLLRLAGLEVPQLRCT
jgi:hypothetical protein